MKKLIYILPLVLTLPLLAGCKKNNIQTGNLEGYINCTAEEKAAEACNMIYSPVCGNDGETYGNSCVACSSQKINSYKIGECSCDAENGICNVSNGEQDINNNIEHGNIGDDFPGDGNAGENQNAENHVEDIPETVIEVPAPNF